MVVGKTVNTADNRFNFFTRLTLFVRTMSGFGISIFIIGNAPYIYECNAHGAFNYSITLEIFFIVKLVLFLEMTIKHHNNRELDYIQFPIVWTIYIFSAFGTVLFWRFSFFWLLQIGSSLFLLKNELGVFVPHLQDKYSQVREY